MGGSEWKQDRFLALLLAVGFFDSMMEIPVGFQRADEGTGFRPDGATEDDVSVLQAAQGKR